MKASLLIWLGALSILPIGAAAETAAKPTKSRGASTAPAQAKTTASSTPPQAVAPAATTATETSAAPAAGGSTAAATSPSSSAAGDGSQAPEASHFAWSTPFTRERFSVSIGPQYGSNDLNLGFGARGGYTLVQSVYFGMLADYWFGTSQEATVPGAGSIKASSHGWDVMGDVGYDFAPSPTLVLRPFVGFGIFGAFGESCTNFAGPTGAANTCVSSSGTKGAGALGGQVLADLHGINLGGELRLIFAGDTAALIGARVGTTF
jgi:hypothetical protein